MTGLAEGMAKSLAKGVAKGMAKGFWGRASRRGQGGDGGGTVAGAAAHE
jgi:hypothetical protein